MKFRKVIAALAAAAMLVTATACSGSTSSTDDSDTNTAADSDTVYTIGICQLVQHDALDAATQGFKDALTEKLGDNVVFDEQNANGESANCTTICTGFV